MHMANVTVSETSLQQKQTFKKAKENTVLTKRSRGEKALFGIVFTIFVLYGLSLVMPFLYLFVNSFKDGLEYINDLNGGGTLSAPDKWLFGNYLEAFTGMTMIDSMGNEVNLIMMFFNSVWYALVCVFASVAASTLTAYCVSKYKFKLRGFFYGIAIFTMTIPIVSATGAQFKLADTIGIYNTPLYPIIMNFSGFGFNFLVLYGFFSNIPWSYAEAVFIDGGGHGTVFFKIMLPQALPTMLTLGIMSVIGSWNDYQTVLLFLPDFPTLASGIYRIEQSITRGGNYPIYFAGLLISIVPIIVLFSCFSNTIMKNFTVGGLKG